MQQRPASSNFINPYPDDSVLFDPANGAYRVEGRVEIIGDPGDSFTRTEVIALDLNVVSEDDYKIRSYSIAKDNLRIGTMSGSILLDSLGNRTAVLTAFRLMQRVDPDDPTQKFEQVFGCPTISDGCGTALYGTVLPPYPSGNPVPPSGPTAFYGVVLTDGRSDACCGARANGLNFFYETPEKALASFRLTWDREASYTLTGPAPEGLPAIPLPGGLPLLVGAIGMLGIVARRRRRAAGDRG